ncbi:MAG: hypothetical protein MRZ61_02200 [Oscillospiraceae bacterium]|nr:hypothetical protein [Oscillospiraceae bacterium]
MKMKKILAALAASTMAVAMLGLTVSAEGEEATEDTIGEEVVDEPEDVVDEPEDVVDEPEEEYVEEPGDEPADEPADVPAENPGTGNSPIALAVIPVALAAAAVVAKKVK